MRCLSTVFFWGHLTVKPMGGTYLKAILKNARQGKYTE